jgi:hypothetical protein
MEIEKEVIDCVNDLLNKVVKKEQNRIYNKKYYENNTEKEKQRLKKYIENNTEKRKKTTKEYREKNKEKEKQYQKKWRESPKGKKTQRISQWKSRGIITDNYDALYNHYLKTAYCDACRVELTYDRYNTATTKCVDHDHSITDAPNFRNIICHMCNVKRR